jgi:seryl-tRNA synthetase
MLDPEFIRQNADLVKKKVAAKRFDEKLVDEFLFVDSQYRAASAEHEALLHKKNLAASERNVELGKQIKQQLSDQDQKLTPLEIAWTQTLIKIPNLPLDTAPVGKSEDDNVEIRRVGKIPQFGFTPQDHLMLGNKLGILDFERGAKVSGSGFYYLKGKGVLLELALIRYALDLLSQKGFIIVQTPDLARSKYYLGTGYSPRGDEAQTYEIKDQDLGLIATAEVTLAGLHAEEILKATDLPKRYVGLSHCYRQEAGAYGKYSKGLYRVHQFTKVEMFCYTKPEDSFEMHQELLQLEEEIWKQLGIPYRVLEMCTADLGAQAARKIDLEAWMPGRGGYGEITSTSNTIDYQARRLDIRYQKEGGKISFVHTLNGTALATSRTLVTIMENYQRADGSIEIPEVLQRYAGFNEITA